MSNFNAKTYYAIKASGIPHDTGTYIGTSGQFNDAGGFDILDHRFCSSYEDLCDFAQDVADREKTKVSFFHRRAMIVEPTYVTI